MRTPGFAIFAIRVVKSPKDQKRAVIVSSPSQDVHACHSFPQYELNSKNLLFGQLSAHVKSKPQLTVESLGGGTLLPGRSEVTTFSG